MSAAGLYPAAADVTESEPRFSALPLASCMGAFVASHRIAAALFARERYGHGEQIEVPLYDACFQLIGIEAEVPWSRHWASDQLMGKVPGAVGIRKAADGRYVQNTGPTRGVQRLFDRFAPEFNLSDLDTESIAKASDRLRDLWLQMPAAEWERYAQEELGSAFALVQSSEEWLHDEHALQSASVISVDDSQLGPTLQAGFPVALSRTPPRVRAGRANDVTDVESIISSHTPSDLAQERPLERSAASSPLAGVRVVDASSLLAGPMSTRILAQYGADVIKLEKAGVAIGKADPLTDDPSAMMGHRTVNAGKRMLLVDLKSTEGQAIVHKMLESADIIHHNFPDVTADRLGIGKVKARELNPDIICSRVSTHSVGGFRESYRGHEPLGQAVTGISHRLGGDGPPIGAPLLLNDMSTGHLAAFGIILALFHRMRTGETQEVNAALSRTSTMVQLPFMLTFEGKIWDEPSGQDVTGWNPVNRLYRGTDGWFYLAAHHERGLVRLAGVDGLEVADTIPDDQLEDWLVERFTTEPVATWVGRLLSVGAGAHRYTNIAELVTSDETGRRRLMALLDHPGLGKAWGIALPRIGSNSQSAELLVSRRPGMDTLDILEEFGFREAIPDLLRSGVVAIGEAPLIETRMHLGYSLAKGHWNSRQNSESFLVGAALASALARLDETTPLSSPEGPG